MSPCLFPHPMCSHIFLELNHLWSFYPKAQQFLPLIPKLTRHVFLQISNLCMSNVYHKLVPQPLSLVSLTANHLSAPMESYKSLFILRGPVYTYSSNKPLTFTVHTNYTVKKGSLHLKSYNNNNLVLLEIPLYPRSSSHRITFHFFLFPLTSLLEAYSEGAMGA